MKTKSPRTRTRGLLFAGALVLAELCCQAQSNVVSDNVVGYYNVLLSPGYNFLANQLDATDNGLTIDNGLNNVLPYSPDGAKVYLWDVRNQRYTPPSTFTAATTNWDINYSIPPGTGFVMLVTGIWTNTIVGQVLQGSLTNFVAGSNRFSLVSSKVPQSGEITSVHAFPGTDGDNVYFFTDATQTFSDGYTFFNGFGWFDPNGAAGPGGPTNAVGQPFFVQNPGPDTNWVRHFIVQAPPPPGVVAGSSGATPARVSRLRISGGAINLAVSNPSGGPYNVQFSTDGLAWTTVATGQTGALWTGPCPGGAQGLYRAAQP
jgi:hypothetical protein